MTDNVRQGLNNESQCPCGSGCRYAECCGVYLARKSDPETAEQLMRSRYTAYVSHAVDYLYQTTHPDKRTTSLQAEITTWAGQVEFVRLEVVSVRQGQSQDKLGKVEFIAHYRQQQQVGVLREVSRFRRYKRQWYYFDGEIN